MLGSHENTMYLKLGRQNSTKATYSTKLYFKIEEIKSLHNKYKLNNTCSFSALQKMVELKRTEEKDDCDHEAKGKNKVN